MSETRSNYSLSKVCFTVRTITREPSPISIWNRNRNVQSRDLPVPSLLILPTDLPLPLPSRFYPQPTCGNLFTVFLGKMFMVYIKVPTKSHNLYTLNHPRTEPSVGIVWANYWRVPEVPNIGPNMFEWCKKHLPITGVNLRPIPSM